MNKRILRVFLVLIIIAGLAAFRIFHLEHYLSLNYLKSIQLDFDGFYREHPTSTVALYFGAYILATALSLPGATILTLAAGAFFGFTAGLILVSFASSIGATAAFISSRFILRESIQAKFRDKIANINRGIEKEGAFYLFTLRLIPVFPFFLVNLVMGLTSIRTFTFYWVSQLGMLAGTAVYVNAGTQLSQLQSIQGILSPKMLASFSAIGILPIVSKFLIANWEARKDYRRFKRPKHFDYNMVVIGGGSAGLVSAYIAAAVRAKVAQIENHKMGGDCLNTGCVPSKAFIRSAKILSYMKRHREFGLKDAHPNFEFAEVMDRVHRTINTVAPHDSRERYTSLGVECIDGSATIKTPFEVEVNGRTLTTRNIVIATGAKPFVPPTPGLDQISYFTSDTVWGLRTLPRRLLILGGGPIGCELAQAFARFGSQVIQVDKGPRLMSREDDDVAELIQTKFRAEGISILLNHNAKEFRLEKGLKYLICESNGIEVRVEFDEVIIALGRKANVTGFGLEELGITLTKNGTIEHDEFLRTRFPNIYVCGDVAGPYQFTHTAAHQAWYAAVNALFSPFKKFKANYRVIPWCTFTDPEVARVGLSETEARERKIAYEVTRYSIDDLDRAITEEEAHGFVKVLTAPGKDQILGATIVGAHAGDIICEYVAAMKHGFGLNKILGTIHIYPTFAESNKYVAGNWKKAHAPKKALAYLAGFHDWRRS